MRLCFLTILACAASLAVAAPVERALSPGPTQSGQKTRWDLDLDGVNDLSADSEEGTMDSIPGSVFGSETLYPRAGMEFLLDGNLSYSSLLLLPQPSTVGAASATWSATPGFISLATWAGTRSRAFSGVFAGVPSGWIGFRLQRGGLWYYGALQGGAVPGGPESNALAPCDIHRVIIESEPDTPVTIPATPTLVLVHFGTTDLGGYATRHLSVTNDQSTPLTNLAFTLDGTDAADFVLDAQAIAELAPGATANFSVTFVPAIEGKVSTAAVHVGEFKFALSATAGRSLIPVRVEEVGGNVIPPLSLPIDFGSPMVGKSTSKSFRITNTGTAPILNLQASVDEPTGSLYYWGQPSYPPWVEHALIYGWQPTTGPVYSGFSVNSSPPAILSPGESTTISIRWSPYETQAKTRIVRFAGSNSAPANVVVTGAATPYVFTTPRLAGLHYRFGESPDWLEAPASYEGPMLSSSSLNYPDESGLTPSTARRWTDWVPNSGSYLMRQPDSRWQAFELLYLEPTRSSGINYPEVSGPNSAWGKMGSRLGLEIADRNYLRSVGAMLKLPATDRVGMELWMKPTWANDKPVSGEQCVSFVGQTVDAGFGLWLVDGAVQGRAGATRVTLSSALSAEWHHVALLLNGGRLSLRIDGVESAVADGASLPTSVKSFTVGMTYYGTNPAQVTLDELRLFELADDFDPNTDLLLTAKPTAQVDKTTLDFGNVPLKTAPAQDFHLTNTGPGWLRILSVRLTGEAAAEFSYQSAESQLLQPDRPADPTYSPGLLSIVGGTLTLSRGAIQPPGIGWLGDNTMRAAVAPGASMRINVLHLPSALGNRQATLTLTTDDPVHPMIEIELHTNATPSLPAQLELSPNEWQWGTLLTNEWQWGTLLTNESRSFELYPRNSGGESLTQLQAEIVGPHAGDYTLTTSGFTSSTILPPVEIRFGRPPTSSIPSAVTVPPKLTVAVQPRAAGPRIAWLRIHSNDPAHPVLDIPMYGRGVLAVPKIEIKGMLYYPYELAYGPNPIPMQGSMDFGALMRTTETSAGYVYYYSTGTRALTISRVTLSGPNASDFVLDPANTGLLLPGQFGSTTVKFTPSGEGLRTATLRIESDDPNKGVYEIALTGRMLPPTPVLVVDQGGMNPTPLANEFLRLGTAVVRGFRNAGYTLPTKTLRLKNTGTGALTNARLSFTGPNADEFTATIPASIAPDASGDIVVSFDPADIRPRSAVLHIETDAGSVGEVAVGGTGAYGAKASFTPDLPEGWVTTAMAELPDGTVILAGYTLVTRVIGPPGTFEQGAPPTIKRMESQIYTINRDGNVSDMRSASPHPFQLIGIIHSIAVATNGGLLLAGDFHGVAPSTSAAVPYAVGNFDGAYTAARQGIAMIDSAGIVASSFVPPRGDFVGRAVVALPDGKVMVGGSGSLGGRKNLIRLNADGSLDTTFTLPEPNGPVNALAWQDDGKVLVGGEFTNLGQAYVPGPFPHYGIADNPTWATRLTMYGEIVAGSEAGLCRLNTDGTNDLTFGNPGFHSVTALAVQGNRIAVGGLESREAFRIVFQFLYVTSPPSNPPPPLNVPCARLLTLSGQTLARADMDATPRVVALQPGDRMHIAPGNPVAFFPLPLHPGVALVQPQSAQSDAWGFKSEATQPSVTDGTQVSAPLPQIFHIQQFEGEINALLPQADGKMFVGGSLINAYVDSMRSDDSSVTIPRSNETPLNGFAQLDSDGFVNRTVEILNQRDGLSKLIVPAIFRAEPPPSQSLSLSGFDRTPGVYLPIPGGSGQRFDGQIFFDGPDADEFDATDGNDPQVSYLVAPAPAIIIHCRTHRSGVHRAVLHIVQNGIENPFDIALESINRIPGAPDFHVGEADDSKALINGVIEDFGSVFVGSHSSKTLRIVNDSAASMTNPLTITLTNSEDFSISKAPLYPITSDASSDFVVTFNPKFNGKQQSTRTAVLRISDGSSETPIEIHLTGEALQHGHIIPDPHDTLALVGQPIMLTAYPQGPLPMIFQWLQDRKTIVGATANTFTIPMAKLTDAGSYTLRTTSLSGVFPTTTTEAALVGVVDMKPQSIYGFTGKPVVMECKVAGLGLPYKFQWQKDGVPLTTASARSAKLNLKRLVASDAGNYTCEVSLGTAKLVTPPITLRLYLPPVLSQGFASTTWLVNQPINEHITAQSLGAVAIVVNGLPPGVSANVVTGVVSGKATKVGTYRVRMVAWNRQGRSNLLEQTITVRPWDSGFVGTAYGPVSLLTGGTAGEWTVTTTSSGTFTAKIREGSSRIAAGKDATGHALFGGIKETSFVGTLTPLPDSPDDEIDRAGATLTAGASGRFRLTMESYHNELSFVHFERTDKVGHQTSGTAVPRLAIVPLTQTGSFVSDAAGTRESPVLNAASALSSRFTISTRGTCAWAARIGGDFGIRAVTGSSPVMADGVGWPTWQSFAVLPDRSGGRQISGEGWNSASVAPGKPDFLTSFAECTGSLEEPADSGGEHYLVQFYPHKKL